MGSSVAAQLRPRGGIFGTFTRALAHSIDIVSSAHPYCTVDQWSDRCLHTAKVVGSNPTRATIELMKLLHRIWCHDCNEWFGDPTDKKEELQKRLDDMVKKAGNPEHVHNLKILSYNQA